MAYKNLFSPIMLGNVEVKNRIALAPMGTGVMNDDETLPDEAIDYYVARARGGTGLILSQFGRVSRYQTTKLLGLYEDRFIPSLRRVADAVHRNGAKMFVQIATLGGRDPAGVTYAPSAIESVLYSQVPRELTKDQIQEIIGEFIQGARRVMEAGFDGVELHGAHSYLVGQFMSPHCNKRTDEYGGDFDGRMRFPVEIVRGIRRELGTDVPIGFKFNAFEDLPEGIGFDLAPKIARRMVDEGIIYVHAASASTVENLTDYPACPTMYLPRNTLIPLAENIKKTVTEVPIIGTGSVDDPDEAEEIIASGRADMVAIGRGLIADPEWANHAQTGASVVPCIRCNICHYEAVYWGNVLVCSVNPYVAKEAEAPLAPAANPKKVMVVGGGPTGIVAALTASRRGHRVTLYEKQNALGGQMVPGGIPPFKEEIGRLLKYYEGEIAESDVEVKLGVAVTPELIREAGPDALIVAVGARFRRLSIPGADEENVFTAGEVLRDWTIVKGDTVVVIGGGDVGCETATYLQENGKQATVVEIENTLMPENEMKNLTLFLEDRMRRAGVTALTGVDATEIVAGEVKARRNGETLSLPADAVVFAVGLEADEGLVNSLKAACPESYVIGDCATPARILEATHEGDRVGREV